MHLVGLKKNVELNIREKLTISPEKKPYIIKELLKCFDEVVIISTCNRTEIYFNQSFKKSDEEVLKEIFEITKWDDSFKKYIFHLKGDKVSNHLMEVACGFHSKILGEDQILGQIKDSYMESLKLKAVRSDLLKLFELAITCGKKFKTQAKLYKIPVSPASIVVKFAIDKRCKKFMVIGYGEMGKLTLKYILSNDNIKEVFIAVRDKDKLKNINNSKVKVIDLKEKKQFIDNMDCVISCTSSPHRVIQANDIKAKGEKIIFFDLAVPRDIEKSIENNKRVELYDIDDISRLDLENKSLRKKVMEDNRYILDKYIKDYNDFKKIREIIPVINHMKLISNDVCNKRFNVFENKFSEKKENQLVKTLIDSTANVYVNRAIEVLKEEKLKGREDECLRIIEKIFLIKEK